MKFVTKYIFFFVQDTEPLVSMCVGDIFWRGRKFIGIKAGFVLRRVKKGTVKVPLVASYIYLEGYLADKCDRACIAGKYRLRVVEDRIPRR